VTRIFGTDGVRGVANGDLTPERAFAIGRAGATMLAHGSERHRAVIVGRDTRLSGTMLEAAIIAGVTSVGRDIVSIGIAPTPAVAIVTVREAAAAGVMISASHNPIADNGIKFFGPDGFKLSDADEDEIESLLGREDLPRPTGVDIGVARVAQNLVKDYYESLYAGAADLSGFDVVVDAAFGAAYAIAPYALRKLGATVHEINAENDGSRINVRCGATDLTMLREKVNEIVATGRERVIGVAFDGDADRALFVDETGTALSGDHAMYVLGCDAHARGELVGDTIVGTVMSNIGLERALARRNISLLRTAVGDRYVLERMREGGFTFGGEQSGHIIDLRRNTTGDGPMTAIALLSILARSNRRLHDLAADVVVAPQILLNVRTTHTAVLDDPQVVAAGAAAQAELEGTGRLLIRASGTEPLIRVMVEGDDRSTIERIARQLVRQIEASVLI
jgi:phosphoglucosamine mutase